MVETKSERAACCSIFKYFFFLIQSSDSCGWCAFHLHLGLAYGPIIKLPLKILGWPLQPRNFCLASQTCSLLDILRATIPMDLRLNKGVEELLTKE